MTRWRLGTVCGGTYVLVLGLYVYTLCPTVDWADSGELITAAYVAGISHPPGQSLYTMLGWVFTHLPGLPSPAYGMNLMSAVFGALTWAFIAGWLWEEQRARDVDPRVAGLSAVAAALTGAAGQITWSQSVIAENTTLHTAFMAGLVWWAWRMGAGPRLADGPLLRRMLAWAFVYGLSATNHPAGVFLFPAFAGWFLYAQGRRLLRPHWVLAMLGCAAAGLLPVAYLYVASRANPPLDWGNPENWHNFRLVVSAHQYQSDAVRELSLTSLGAGAHALGRTLWNEWGMLGGALLAVGWLRLARRNLALALWSLPVLAVFVYLSANPAYIGAYLVPLFLFLAPALAESLAWVLGTLQTRGRLGLAVGALLVALVPGATTAAHWDANNRRGDDLAKRFAETVLGGLPPGAIIVTESANLHFIGLYMRWCEQYRPDVILLSANALSRPGYQTTCRRNFPDLDWPDTFAPAPEFAAQAPQVGIEMETLNPWWIKSLLLDLYDRNAGERRMFWETPTAYAPLLDRFVQQGYVFELRRPLSGGRTAAWERAAPAVADLTVPEPWDARVTGNRGARTTYADAVGVVADTFRVRGQWIEAADMYARALELDANKPWLWSNRGMVLGMADRPRDAETAFLEAVRQRPDRGMYSANLANIYEQQGRPLEALRWNRTALARWPEAPWVTLTQAARLELAQGDPGRALGAMQRALAARPDHAPTAIDLSTMALRQDRLDVAIPAVQAAVRLEPDSVRARFNAAWLAAAQGESPDLLRERVALVLAADPETGRRLVETHPRLRGFLPGIAEVAAPIPAAK